MHANIQKSGLTPEEKQAQIVLSESMALNTLLTGLDPKIAHIVRASNPKDLLQAQIRIRRELQLSYFEIQKTNRPNPPRPNQNNQPIRRPNFQPPRCTFCGRIGHSNNECRSRQNSQNNSQNFNDTRNFSSYQNFNNAQNNGFQRQNFNPNNTYQNTRRNDQQRPLVQSK
uniref:GATA zinc finger domain-containing protein 14-like n=1 Tax=Diabrotica virgifera virgifera TaxID=50390 RepID=A0A6P7GDX2_DIAVI